MRAFGFLLIAPFVLACAGALGSGTDGGASGAASVDGGLPDSGTGSPAGSCTPVPGSTGNSLHVGAYCSPGGNECAAWGQGSLACAIDLDPKNGGKFCILIPCATSADCGALGCCTGDPGNPIHACVPIGCVTDTAVCPPIPTADAGTADGGPQDGGTLDSGSSQLQDGGSPDA